MNLILKGQSRQQQTSDFATSFLIFEKNKVWYDMVWNIIPYLLFLKKQQNLKLSSDANVGGALRVKGITLPYFSGVE